MTQRHWIGEAQAAFDQALGQIEGFGTAEIWLQRAQAAATLASAEQTRIANLIAWKQLQATRQASSDAGVGMLPLGTDETADEIEAALGIADPRPEPVDESRVRPAEVDFGPGALDHSVGRDTASPWEADQ